MGDKERLETTAKAMLQNGKGILAADESMGTLTKRFSALGIQSTPENRRAYREFLFTTPGIGDYISSAILFDETIRQNASDGRAFVQALNAAGIIPGIKVDTGARPLAGSPDETVTEGLDGLRQRFNDYYQMGARFAKWRAVIRIGSGRPSRYCIEVNAHALGRYAALAQEAGLVPIVEPEVLADGKHDIERSRQVTERVLHTVFDQLMLQGILLEGIVLKPNMVTPGLQSGADPNPGLVAQMTLQTLRRTVPAAVPGIAFLSGGQSGEEACANLNAMASDSNAPWALSFSFGRALQYPALPTWGGHPENVPAAKSAFLHRARMSSLAALGQYSPEMEREAAQSSVG